MKCRSAVASSRRSTCVPADAHWAAASPLPEGELLTFQPCCRSLCGGAPSNRAELSESSPRWYSKTRIFSWSTSATPRRFARARIETFTIAEPGFSGRMPRQTGRTETGDRCRGVEAQGKAATNGSKDRSRTHGLLRPVFVNVPRGGPPAERSLAADPLPARPCVYHRRAADISGWWIRDRRVRSDRRHSVARRGVLTAAGRARIDGQCGCHLFTELSHSN